MLFISIGINDIAKDIPTQVTVANILEPVKKLKESSQKQKYWSIVFCQQTLQTGRTKTM